MHLGRAGVRKVWTARVSADGPAHTGDEMPPALTTLQDLARDAADAAEKSASAAARAARLASYAGALSPGGRPPDVEIEAERIGADLERARATVLDIAESATEAATAAEEARERSYLARIAADFDEPRGEWPENLETQSLTDSASDRD